MKVEDKKVKSCTLPPMIPDFIIGEEKAKKLERRMTGRNSSGTLPCEIERVGDPIIFSESEMSIKSSKRIYRKY